MQTFIRNKPAYKKEICFWLYSNFIKNVNISRWGSYFRAIRNKTIQPAEFFLKIIFRKNVIEHNSIRQICGNIICNFVKMLCVPGPLIALPIHCELGKNNSFASNSQ